jgi:hypothetical protein
VAAIFNHYIPKVPIDHKMPQRNFVFLMRDFWHAFTTLWRDPQGQVSLAVTTLFWGAGATLQFVILQWAKEILHMEQQAASILIAVLDFWCRSIHYCNTVVMPYWEQATQLPCKTLTRTSAYWSC